MWKLHNHFGTIIQEVVGGIGKSDLLQADNQQVRNKSNETQETAEGGILIKKQIAWGTQRVRRHQWRQRDGHFELRSCISTLMLMRHSMFVAPFWFYVV